MSHSRNTVILLVSTLLLLALSGCRSWRKTVTDTTTTQRELRDSLTIIERITQATIQVPGDSVKGEVLTPTDSNGIIPFEKTFTSGRATATVKGAGNKINVECDCSEWEAVVDQKEREITRVKSQIDKKVKERKKEKVVEKGIPGWVNFLAWTGGIAWVIIILVFLKKFI